MEITLDKMKLSTTLSFLDKVIKKKDVSEVYKNCQFKFENNSLTLYACGGQYVVKSSYGRIGATNMSCLVEYDALNKLIPLLDNDEIIFKFNSDNMVIFDGGNEYTFQYFVEGDFANIIDSLSLQVSSEPIVVIDVSELEKINKFVYPCIDTTKNATLCGVFYDGNFVTTDIKSCAIYHYDEKESDDTIFIPKDGFDIISTLSEKDLTFSFHHSENIVIAQSENVSYLIPLMSAKFPSYKPLVEHVSKYKNQVRIDKGKFVKSCSKLLAFSTSMFSAVNKADFEINDIINMKAGSDRKRAIEELAPIESNSNGKVGFSVNVAQLLSQVSKIDESEITLKYEEGSKNPLYFYGDENKMYLTTLLVGGEENGE